MKGAVERVLDRCLHVGLGEGKIPLTAEHKARIIEHMDGMAAEGLRVLCLAGKLLPAHMKDAVKSMPRDELEKDFSLLGLVGI